MPDSKDAAVETSSLSQCSTKVNDQQAMNQTASSAKNGGKNRSIFKREEKEAVPEWKREQEKKFKEWNRSKNKQQSTTGFFTDFYKPRQGKNKGFWVWWM